MKKLKFMPAVLMLVASFAILAIGIYAVAPTKNTLKGTITVNSANPEVLISAFFHNEDGSLNTQTPIMTRVPARHGIDINLGDSMEFDTSECNTVADLANLDIKVTIRVENPGSTALGVYFSDKVMEAEATSGDIATEKALTDSTGEDDFVKATMDGYQELPAKSGETMGMAETTITYSLLQFVTGDTNPTVDLNAEANRMYLNIEKANEDLLPAKTELAISSTAEATVGVELLKDGEVIAGAETTGASPARALSTIAPLATDIEVNSENEFNIRLDDYTFIPGEDNVTHYTFRLTNKSATQSLGAYFYTGEALPTEDNDELGIKAGYATAESIKLTGEVFSREDGTQIAEVYLDTYSYIAKADGDASNFDVLNMDIWFYPYGEHATTKTGQFSFTLNIEPYVGNCSETTKGSEDGFGNYDGGTTFNGELLKISDEITTLESGAFASDNSITHVVVPNSITTITWMWGTEGRFPLADPFVDMYALKATFCGASPAVDQTGYDPEDCYMNDDPPETVSRSLFGGCGELKYVNVAEDIDLTDTYIFKKTERVNIPSGTTSIADEQFSYYSNLKSIVIPESVTSIGARAFAFCSSLETITIPNSVKTIGEEAFRSCRGLTSIVIPESVTNIASDAFKECKWLTSIVVEEGNTVYDSRNNCNAIIETANNKLILGCTSTVIPNDIKIIGDEAFYGYGEYEDGAPSFGSIDIPNSVEQIGANAFYYCWNMYSLTLPTQNKDGYTFKGWYDNAEGTGDPVTVIDDPSYYEHPTYYAVFTEN